MEEKTFDNWLRVVVIVALNFLVVALFLATIGLTGAVLKTWGLL